MKQAPSEESSKDDFSMKSIINNNNNRMLDSVKSSLFDTSLGACFIVYCCFMYCQVSMASFRRCPSAWGRSFAAYGLLGRGLSPLYLYLREKDHIGEKSDNNH